MEVLTNKPQTKILLMKLFKKFSFIRRETRIEKRCISSQRERERERAFLGIFIIIFIISF